MKKFIQIMVAMDNNGEIKSVANKKNLTVAELGLFTLEIERILNKFKEEYFSHGVTAQEW